MPAEYRQQPAGKQRSRPVAQDHNALCSKHQRKGKGHPWWVTEAGGKHVAGLGNLPVLDIGAVVHFDSVSNVASSRVHPASPRPKAYLPRCRQRILQNEPRHPCVVLCLRIRVVFTIQQQTQGATPVDPENASGKRGELEPIQGGDIGNLAPFEPPPGGEPSSAPLKNEEDVDMGEGGEEEGESAEENEEEDAAQLEAIRARLEDQARKYLAQQTHQVIIPSYAAWFDMSKIHEVERRAVPEFFNSRNRSKTPSIYKEYRDFMINAYRLRPTEYLTVTACRRNLAGDVCAIMRVHAFVEQWGLINYQVRLELSEVALRGAKSWNARLTQSNGLRLLHHHSRVISVSFLTPLAVYNPSIPAHAQDTLEPRIGRKARTVRSRLVLAVARP